MTTTLDNIAKLMFTQMDEQLKSDMKSARVMSPAVAREVKILFQKDYEKNHREDDDPLVCPYYEYQIETLFPGVVRLTVEHKIPVRMEVLA